jgi:hypothetical protein
VDDGHPQTQWGAIAAPRTIKAGPAVVVLPLPAAPRISQKPGEPSSMTVSCSDVGVTTPSGFMIGCQTAAVAERRSRARPSLTPPGTHRPGDYVGCLLTPHRESRPRGAYTRQRNIPRHAELVYPPTAGRQLLSSR